MGTKRPKIETPQFALIEYDEKELGFGIVNVKDLASNNPLVPFKIIKLQVARIIVFYGTLISIKIVKKFYLK